MHELDRLCIKRWADHIKGSVIDAGCCPGHWTDFRHRRSVEVQGGDLVPEFNDRAREHFPGVPYRVAPLRDLGVPEGSLHGVLARYSRSTSTPNPPRRSARGALGPDPGRTSAHRVFRGRCWPAF
ncbi:methyltransferase domain-containing protein [Arthrobacter sp.]|uniref:methyltransferase domain-containing protein n=1 Tax=Arthrobacter sp. TaxID=1667 RepID=UPI0039C88EBB